MGPTAVGKSDLAIEIAKRLDVVLISVDSVMVYRGMDIGTAKPSTGVLSNFAHALVNIREPEEGYSVKEFLQDADEAVCTAIEHGKIPLLVGGTMMYFKAFRDGISELPEADPQLRDAIRDEISERGTEAVYQELVRVDPAAARNIHPRNVQRMERALEVFRLTGQSISELWATRKKRSVAERLDCEIREIAMMDIDRGLLHERIEQRVDSMLMAGFENEVRDLMTHPNLTSASPAMKSVGYQQMWKHLEGGEGSGMDAGVRDSMVFATRQLARRQLVWLRNWGTLGTSHRVPFDVTIDEVVRLCSVD